MSDPQPPATPESGRGWLAAVRSPALAISVLATVGYGVSRLMYSAFLSAFGLEPAALGYGTVDMAVLILPAALFLAVVTLSFVLAIFVVNISLSTSLYVGGAEGTGRNIGYIMIAAIAAIAIQQGFTGLISGTMHTRQAIITILSPIVIGLAGALSRFIWLHLYLHREVKTQSARLADVESKIEALKTSMQSISAHIEQSNAAHDGDFNGPDDTTKATLRELEQQYDKTSKSSSHLIGETVIMRKQIDELQEMKFSSLVRRHFQGHHMLRWNYLRGLAPLPITLLLVMTISVGAAQIDRVQAGIEPTPLFATLTGISIQAIEHDPNGLFGEAMLMGIHDGVVTLYDPCTGVTTSINMTTLDSVRSKRDDRVRCP